MLSTNVYIIKGLYKQSFNVCFGRYNWTTCLLSIIPSLWYFPQSAIKSSSTKDKPKDKKKKSVPELVQDTPVRRLLGSVHVPLQSLITGGEKVDVLCELGSLHVESAVAATRTLDKVH